MDNEQLAIISSIMVSRFAHNNAEGLVAITIEYASKHCLTNSERKKFEVILLLFKIQQAAILN